MLRLSWTGDDAIAMSGSYMLVASFDAGKKTVILAAREYAINPGDELTFYAADTAYLGTTTITKMYSVDQPPETSGKSSEQLQNFAYDDLDYMKVGAHSSSFSAIVMPTWYASLHQHEAKLRQLHGMILGFRVPMQSIAMQQQNVRSNTAPTTARETAE
jgi:hypothetical protein